MRKASSLLAALLVASSCVQAQPPSALISQLENLAERGSGEAQYHLGMAYWTGTGVEKNPEQAVTRFRQAAQSGDPLGAYKLGCLFDGQDGMFERDPAKALHYKLIAANAGYALAQQDVAGLYAERGDYRVAVQWIERAAKQGTPGALQTYASIHNGAPGIARKPVVTATYFRLFLDRPEASPEQHDWLTRFEQKLTPTQRNQARQIVASYRPEPTALTLKALSGVEAANRLVGAN